MGSGNVSRHATECRSESNHNVVDPLRTKKTPCLREDGPSFHSQSGIDGETDWLPVLVPLLEKIQGLIPLRSEAGDATEHVQAGKCHHRYVFASRLTSLRLLAIFRRPVIVECSYNNKGVCAYVCHPDFVTVQITTVNRGRLMNSSPFARYGG